MNITFAPREILQIDGARIVFRNFEGREDKYNHKGDRNFALVIPDRVLSVEEVRSFLDIYRDAEMVPKGDGEVLMYNDTEIITVQECLTALGWNIKINPPHDVDDSPFMFMKVKVKFNDRGPNVFLQSGSRKNRLTEKTVSTLDYVDIAYVDLDIRPYDWEVSGKTGRTAYLQGCHVIQNIDRISERFAEEEYPE